jgi:hypothetical protein
MNACIPIYTPHILSNSPYNDSSMDGRADGCICIFFCLSVVCLCSLCTRWGNAVDPEDLCLRALTLIERPVSDRSAYDHPYYLTHSFTKF